MGLASVYSKEEPSLSLSGSGEGRVCLRKIKERCGLGKKGARLSPRPQIWALHGWKQNLKHPKRQRSSAFTPKVHSWNLVLAKKQDISFSTFTFPLLGTHRPINVLVRHRVQFDVLLCLLLHALVLFFGELQPLRLRRKSARVFLHAGETSSFEVCEGVGLIPSFLSLCR